MADEEVALDEENEVGASEAPAEAELSEDQKILAKLKEAVIVDQQDIGTLRKKLTITVPRATIDERLHEQFSELRRDALIPGFRKGRAPLRLVEKRFGSDVGDQLIAQLVSTSFLAATEKHEIKPLGDPLLWVKMPEERTDEGGKTTKVETEKLVDLEHGLEHMRLPHDGPLVYSCEVELRPEFELPPLERIPIEKPKLAITDRDVDVEVRRLLALRAQLVPVDDRPIEAHDALVVELKGTSGGAVIRSESNVMLFARDQQYWGILLAGFGQAVVGQRSGDVVTLTATIPDDHENIDHRGQSIDFEFTVREVKRFVLPALDAEFLAALGFESEQELRDVLRRDLDSRLAQAIRDGTRSLVAKYLIEHTQLEIPSGLSQRQADRLVARRMIEMYQAGTPQSEIDRQLDELRTKAREEALTELKLFFVLEKVAEQRGVEVGEDELNGAIAQIAARRNRRFDRVRDELSKGNGLQTLWLQLRDQKVLDELLEAADITESEPPPPEQPPTTPE